MTASLNNPQKKKSNSRSSSAYALPTPVMAHTILARHLNIYFCPDFMQSSSLHT
jgi:hypothetical protein